MSKLFKHEDPKINKDFINIHNNVTKLSQTINSQPVVHPVKDVPKSNIGKDGDLAINVLTKDMYHKDKGKWILL